MMRWLIRWYYDFHYWLVRYNPIICMISWPLLYNARIKRMGALLNYCTSSMGNRVQIFKWSNSKTLPSQIKSYTQFHTCSRALILVLAYIVCVCMCVWVCGWSTPIFYWITIVYRCTRVSFYSIITDGWSHSQSRIGWLRTATGGEGMGWDDQIRDECGRKWGRTCNHV